MKACSTVHHETSRHTQYFGFSVGPSYSSGRRNSNTLSTKRPLDRKGPVSSGLTVFNRQNLEI